MQRQFHLQLEHQEEINFLDPVIVDLEYFINLSYVSFSPRQKDNIVLNATYFTHGLSYLLNQLEFHQELQYLVVVSVDLVFQRIPNAASFCIISIFSYEYMFFMEFLLFMIYSLHVFLLSCKQGLHFII
jgi:hypothetical protein